ncbi:MAG: arylsulfatase [Planctomycetaceae bacterium]|nr:arylsulfatase [Planctomycetaceae bacterium]
MSHPQLLLLASIKYLCRLAVLCLVGLTLDQHGFADQPNIVLILADDLGYGDLGCYGQEKIQTPHLDRLASQGMRFTNHYTGSPVCASARCTLLTGKHSAHAEIRGNRDSGNGRAFPGQWPITAEAITIAEVLQEAGYATGGFGKWGLGPTDTSGSPIKQGFDRFYGYNCQRNAHSYYPSYLDDDDRIDEINSRPIPGHRKQPEGEVRAEAYRADVYAPERILDKAIEWLDSNHQRRFFLYLPFVEPHVAMHPPQEWLDHYPHEWDQETGPYRGENGYLPHPRPRAGYAAMISHLDNHVGKIMNRLDELGVADNTLVVFISDNGPTHAGQDKRWSIGGAASEFFDSTGDLKGYKGSCDEGGIRIPCLVRWPGVVRPGTTTNVPSYFPDWFPTFCKAARTKLPTGLQSDGVDLNDTLRGSATLNRSQPMIWEFPQYGGIVAIRDGKWKAIRKGLMTKMPSEWELYDLEADFKEENNLAETHPTIVADLVRAYQSTRTVEPDFPFPCFDQDTRLP